MKIATGIDMIEIARVQAAITRHGQRFLQRIYTPRELDDCGGRIESLAARFAAKEAAAKALGCGIGEISWLEIEVRREANGQPTLMLSGAAEARARERYSNWSVSLSHTRQQAVASVIFAE